MRKLLSLAVVAVIYVLAFLAAAVFVFYTRKSLPGLLCLFLADIIATVIVYLSSLPLKNASVYDPYWSVQPVVLVLFTYIFLGGQFEAAHLFLLIPLGFWAVRLTTNWAMGFTDFKWQDWRYVDLRRKSGKLAELVIFFGIMLMPTLLVFAGFIPLYYMAMFGAEGFSIDVPHFFLILGGAVMLFAAIYQTVADYQLHAHKRRNPSEPIASGLWKFSRHPNYFGEVTLWWGILIGAFPYAHYASKLLLALLGAPLITLLFLFISIPMMERRLLANRPAYADYKNRVKSSLFPLPKKSNRKRWTWDD